MNPGTTDRDGRINFSALLPGGTYTVYCDGPQVGFKTVVEKLTAALGETIDLGQFDVTQKSRPEPKRTAATAEGGKAKAEGGIRKPEEGAMPGATGSASAPSNSRNGLAAMGGAAADGTGKASGTQIDADDDLVTVRGRVIDPQEKPVAAVDVFATYWHYPSEKNPTPVASARPMQMAGSS